MVRKEERLGERNVESSEAPRTPLSLFLTTTTLEQPPRLTTHVYQGLIRTGSTTHHSPSTVAGMIVLALVANASESLVLVETHDAAHASFVVSLCAWLCSASSCRAVLRPDE